MKSFCLALSFTDSLTHSCLCSTKPVESLSAPLFGISCLFVSRLCRQLSLLSAVFAISCLCRQFSLSSVVYVTQFIAGVVVVNRAKSFDAPAQQGAGHWGNCLQHIVCCSTISSFLSSSQHLHNKLHLKPTLPI